ncbi:MAG TPA: SDR family oxidoreductase [Alphaproteobacteria bacterium]
MTAPRLFCFGMGYAATALARSLIAQGWRVAGTSRSAEGVGAIAALGAEGVRFAPGQPLADAHAALERTTHLLSSVPPGEAGDPVLAAHGGDVAHIAGLAWVGYLSATSVYGDRGGGLVDETAAVAPSSARGRRRAGAEQDWLGLGRAHGLAVHVFRLAGIYGPGRSALDQVRAGRARRIDQPGHSFARIHVEDIVTALCASMARPRAGAIYNLCDDAPAPSAEVVAYACELLGAAPPPLVPFAEAARSMSAMQREFWADNRRIDNRLMHEELGVVLRHPSYREGLRAILAGG